MNEIWKCTTWDPPTPVLKIKYNAGPHTSTLSLFLSPYLFSFLRLFLVYYLSFFLSFFNPCMARFLLWSQAEQNLQSIDAQHRCDVMSWNNILLMKHCMTSLGRNFWMCILSTIPNYLSCYWPITKMVFLLSPELITPLLDLRNLPSDEDVCGGLWFLHGRTLLKQL